ncbi:MAG: response regulator [Proteobacteria bacterium]|nr:response regulator [Pseudomonadota bacterium]
MLAIPNVLVVDDEEDYLAILAKGLANNDLNVLRATSGSEALEIMETQQIDVVLLDVVMPGMNGIQTLSTMKKVCPKTEVIILTGLADMETVAEGMRLGAFDYLIKPVQVAKLVYRIQDAYKMKTLKHPESSHAVT